jgi:uncharacterized protein
MAALGGSELENFRERTAAASATLPPAPTTPTIERTYLIALFDDLQSVWRREFAAAHMSFRAARLVVFYSQIHSGCGHADDSGPFYCPADHTIYLDTRFFTLLLRNSHVGKAAQVFIVGHEFAHHVQRLLGIADRVDAANQADPSGQNARSVRVELQADCLAGVWARSAYPRSELGLTDLYEALRTAKVIGDDYLMQSSGQVVDTTLWTHGSSQQRQLWLRLGFLGGRPKDCNTFASG